MSDEWSYCLVKKKLIDYVISIDRHIMHRMCDEGFVGKYRPLYGGVNLLTRYLLIQ